MDGFGDALKLLARERPGRDAIRLPRLPSGKMLRRLLMDRYRSLPPA